MTRSTATRAMMAKNLKWLGVVTLILGGLAVASPLMTGLSVALLVGVLVVAGGIARMFWALRAGSLGRGLFQFAIGGLTLLCGLVLVTDPVFASGVLTIMITIYLVIDGVCEIGAAWRMRPAGGWGWLMVAGVVSVLLGLMIWRQFPLSGAWAIGLMLGVKLMLVGLTMIGMGRIARDETR